MVDQIRAVGVCVRVGELSKIPQKGVEQERGKGKQRFKRGVKGWVPQKRYWNTLTNHGFYFTDMRTTSQSLWYHDNTYILTWIITHLIGTHIHSSTLTFGIERVSLLFTVNNVSSPFHSIKFFITNFEHVFAFWSTCWDRLQIKP